MSDFVTISKPKKTRKTPNFNYNYSELSEFQSLSDIFEKRFSSEGLITEGEEEVKSIKNKWWPRVVWQKIVNWKFFDPIIIFLIIVNSLLLGIIDYENPDSDSTRNTIVKSSEPFFTSIFTLEAILKITSQGFIMGKGAYLKDSWNWLDFIVVITSLMANFPFMSNVSGIRTFRLFRPLRSFTSLSSMRTLIATILSSMVQLGEILIFSAIVFFIFSILGVSLWSGDIHFRWRITEFPLNGDWPVVEGDTRNCGSREWDVGYWGSLVAQ
jgi:hypothetical protein